MLACLALIDLPNPTLEFAQASWEATPQMRMEDAYKWLFHACQGAEHAVKDAETPRRWLEMEWASLGTVPFREVQWVPLRPDGQLGRINLRPFKTQGGNPEIVLSAFMRSASGYRPDRTHFRQSWLELGRKLKRAPWKKLTAADWTRVDALYESRGYPAIGHSDAYEKVYKPAYRVLTRSEFARLK